MKSIFLAINLFFSVVDAPDGIVIRVEDEFRFPYSTEYAKLGYENSLKHLNIVKENLWYYGEVWYEEAYWCFKCWDELDNVKRVANTKEVKLIYLKKLYRWLGDDLWKRGEMPPFVPWWRFRILN